MLPQVVYKAGRATAPVPGVVFELEHGVGLIILRPSGVLWTNQVGGTGCEHPYVEGIYVPLGGGDSTEQCLLGAWDAPWHNCGIGNMPQQWVPRSQEWLDTIFDGVLRLEAGQWKHSGEAWLYVRVAPVVNDRLDLRPIRDAFAGATAVLTWENSD